MLEKWKVIKKLKHQIIILYRRRTLVDGLTNCKSNISNKENINFDYDIEDIIIIKLFNRTENKKYNKNTSLIFLFNFINDVLYNFIFNNIRDKNNHKITKNDNYNQHIQDIEYI